MLFILVMLMLCILVPPLSTEDSTWHLLHFQTAGPLPPLTPGPPCLQVLKYLVPVQLLLGVLPSARLVDRYSLQQYLPIMQVCVGGLCSVDGWRWLGCGC